jgi:hypothetical protein
MRVAALKYYTYGALLTLALLSYSPSSHAVDMMREVGRTIRLRSNNALPVRTVRTPRPAAAPRQVTVHDALDSIRTHVEGRGLQPHQALVGFDLDGTGVKGDVTRTTIQALMDADARRGHQPSLIRPAAVDGMRRVARIHGIDLGSATSSAEIYETLMTAHEKGTLPEATKVEVQAWIFAGWHRDAYRAFVKDVFPPGTVEERAIPQTLAAMRMLKREGYGRSIFSASAIDIVREVGSQFVDEHGARIFEDHELFGIRPKFSKDGIMLADVERPTTFRAGKVKWAMKSMGSWQERRSREFVAFFGDSPHGGDRNAMKAVPLAFGIGLGKPRGTLPRGLVEVVDQLPTKPW